MTFRADNIGSLLRPDYLKAARASFDAGTLSAEGFKQVEDRAVDAAIAMQEAVGLDVVTDGELRRHTFFDQLRGAMHGTIEFAHPAAGVTFHAERSADDIELTAPPGSLWWRRSAATAWSPSRSSSTPARAPAGR
jgi:5-methyltetrahydropteroyltriglutamate--homocysteine methyltransferase